MIKYNATVSILKQTEYAIIFRVFPDYPIRKFIPGQYGSLGLRSDDGTKLIKRAYSISSSIIDLKSKDLHIQNNNNWLEFYINKVIKTEQKREMITPKIFNLNDGDKIFCGEKIIGHYHLNHVEDISNVLLISTHTGESPNNHIANNILRNFSNIKICNINVSPKKGWASLYEKNHQIASSLFNNYKFIQLFSDSGNYKQLYQLVNGF